MGDIIKDAAVGQMILQALGFLSEKVDDELFFLVQRSSFFRFWSLDGSEKIDFSAFRPVHALDGAKQGFALLTMIYGRQYFHFAPSS